MIPKLITVLTLASILLLASAQKQDKPYKGPSEADVIELFPSNFEDTINHSTDTWLLYLYAPWCQHCRTMRPEWAKLATSLKGKVKVAKIDPSDNTHRPKFHKLYQLVSFPRIIILPAGPKIEGVYDVYEGARTAASMEQWALERMKRHKALAVERITEQRVWQQNCIQVESSICVVALMPSLLDASQRERSVYVEIVKTVANNFRDKPVSFMWAGAGDHPEFQTLFNLNSGFPAVLLINPERRVFTTMKAALTEENMQGWLDEVFRSKGGRRFSRFSKEISFNTVSADSNNEGFSQEEL